MESVTLALTSPDAGRRERPSKPSSGVACPQDAVSMLGFLSSPFAIPD